MLNDATITPTRKTPAVKAIECAPVFRPAAPAARIRVIEFDSSAMDIITTRTAEIGALASCAQCLSASYATENDSSFNGHLLIDEALPLLNEVIRRLANETASAAELLWEQYRRAMDAANGEEYHA
jgi:hypothetical protein